MEFQLGSACKYIESWDTYLFDLYLCLGYLLNIGRLSVLPHSFLLNLVVLLSYPGHLEIHEPWRHWVRFWYSCFAYLRTGPNTLCLNTHHTTSTAVQHTTETWRGHLRGTLSRALDIICAFLQILSTSTEELAISENMSHFHWMIQINFPGSILPKILSLLKARP